MYLLSVWQNKYICPEIWRIQLQSSCASSQMSTFISAGQLCLMGLKWLYFWENDRTQVVTTRTNMLHQAWLAEERLHDTSIFCYYDHVQLQNRRLIGASQNGQTILHDVIFSITDCTSCESEKSSYKYDNYGTAGHAAAEVRLQLSLHNTVIKLLRQRSIDLAIDSVRL